MNTHNFSGSSDMYYRVPGKFEVFRRNTFNKILSKHVPKRSLLIYRSVYGSLNVFRPLNHKVKNVTSDQVNIDLPEIKTVSQYYDGQFKEVHYYRNRNNSRTTECRQKQIDDIINYGSSDSDSSDFRKELNRDQYKSKQFKKMKLRINRSRK